MNRTVCEETATINQRKQNSNIETEQIAFKQKFAICEWEREREGETRCENDPSVSILHLVYILLFGIFCAIIISSFFLCVAFTICQDNGKM